MAPSFAIVVAFALHPGQHDVFLPLVRDNAAASVRIEPGCRRFDVVVPDSADSVLLYEIYDDRAAFDAHLASPHYKRFDEQTRTLVAAKIVTTGRLLEHVAADRD